MPFAHHRTDGGHSPPEQTDGREWDAGFVHGAAITVGAPREVRPNARYPEEVQKTFEQSLRPENKAEKPKKAAAMKTRTSVAEKPKKSAAPASTARARSLSSYLGGQTTESMSPGYGQSASGLHCSWGSDLDTHIPRAKLPPSALPPEVRAKLKLGGQTEVPVKSRPSSLGAFIKSELPEAPEPRQPVSESDRSRVPPVGGGYGDGIRQRVFRRRPTFRVDRDEAPPSTAEPAVTPQRAVVAADGRTGADFERERALWANLGIPPPPIEKYTAGAQPPMPLPPPMEAPGTASQGR